jgi:hypothetical protein
MSKLRRRPFTANQTPGAPRIQKTPLTLAAMALLLPLGCHKGNVRAGGTEDAVDITNAKLQRRDPHCSDYVGSYKSSAMDKGEGKSFKGWLTITHENGKCVFTSNSIPNHDFNDVEGNKFVFPVEEVEESFKMTSHAVKAKELTPLSTSWDNAIFLNGAKLDLFAAACEGVEDEKIGCFSNRKGVWRFDPMSKKNDFAADTHHAHGQPPDGAYHYHGDPVALYESSPSEESGDSPVIGFAADGFPIYGPFIRDDVTGKIRRVRSGYTLKTHKTDTGEISKKRQPLPDQDPAPGRFPGGEYDGTYREDYEFTGGGDLDECNGMTRHGQYGYYVTDTFPWVMACFTGTPDPSFTKENPELAHEH